MPAKTHTVLIVDDNPEDRLVCKRLLGGRLGGYRFVECEEGRQGVETLKVFPVDCVLVAFDLPDMDGIAVIEEIVKTENINHIPVVFLTVAGKEDAAMQAIKSGASDYLLKGNIDGEIIKRSIAHAIKKATARRSDELNESMHGVLEAAGAICQELSTPLQAISGNAELKRRLFSNTGDQAALMRKILVQTKRLEGLSRKLKSLTRYEIKEFPALMNKADTAKSLPQTPYH